MLIVVMGVSGCGKTTIGKMLAEKLDVPFYDADNFHSISNIQKMQSGVPLTDRDRDPWLKTLNKKLIEWSNNKGAVLACSALKENYRIILQSKAEEIFWVFLHGTPELIAHRLQLRNKHYMPDELLASQFMSLEEPEYGLKVSIDEEPKNIVEKIIDNL